MAGEDAQVVDITLQERVFPVVALSEQADHSKAFRIALEQDRAYVNNLRGLEQQLPAGTTALIMQCEGRAGADAFMAAYKGDSKA
jgi:hypothetical protein